MVLLKNEDQAMRALAALSRFVGNTFAYWVLIFAVVAFLQPAWFLGLKGAIVPLSLIHI